MFGIPADFMVDGQGSPNYRFNLLNNCDAMGYFGYNLVDRSYYEETSLEKMGGYPWLRRSLPKLPIRLL